MGTHSNRRLGNNRAQDVGIAGNVQLDIGWGMEESPVSTSLQSKYAVCTAACLP